MYWNTEVLWGKTVHIFKSPCFIHADFFKRPITQWNRNRWWKYFRVWIRGLGNTNLWWKKNWFRKSHATVPLSMWKCLKCRIFAKNMHFLIDWTLQKYCKMRIYDIPLSCYFQKVTSWKIQKITVSLNVAHIAFSILKFKFLLTLAIIRGICTAA